MKENQITKEQLIDGQEYFINFIGSEWNRSYNGCHCLRAETSTKYSEEVNIGMHDGNYFPVDFHYREDFYICINGQMLSKKGKQFSVNQLNSRGYEIEIYQASSCEFNLIKDLTHGMEYWVEIPVYSHYQVDVKRVMKLDKIKKQFTVNSKIYELDKCQNIKGIKIEPYTNQDKDITGRLGDRITKDELDEKMIEDKQYYVKFIGKDWNDYEDGFYTLKGVCFKEIWIVLEYWYLEENKKYTIEIYEVLNDSEEVVSVSALVESCSDFAYSPKTDKTESVSLDYESEYKRQQQEIANLKNQIKCLTETIKIMSQN